ncbi:winged helix-turn-helix domain-containing protein [Streptomyces canus]
MVLPVHQGRAPAGHAGRPRRQVRLRGTLPGPDRPRLRAGGAGRGPRSRRDLVRAAWPDGAQVSDNTLDQYLSRLRRKLREAGSGLSLTTARGIGHRLS